MKAKIWIVAAMLLALVLCGTVMLSYAQDSQAAPEKVWQGHRHARMAYLSRELNLTDAQKQQIRSIMQAGRQANLPLMQQVATNKKAMLAATANGAYDQTKVQALANQQGQLMAQLIVQRQAIQHQIYTQVLTPEQRTTADQLRAKQIARIDNRLEKLSQSGTTSSPQQ